MEQEENKRLPPSVQGLGRKVELFYTDPPDGLSGTKVSWVISSGHPPHVHTPGLVWFCTAGLGTPKALCFAELAYQNTYAILPLATHEQGQLLSNPTLKDAISSHHWP